MLSNHQVFKPCTKSCKPNRPIPVAKRYSTNYKVNSFYFQWQVYYNNCLCSLVSNPDHTVYYGRLLRVRVCHCWQFFKVTELLCLVGNKSDSSGNYYSSPVPPSCTADNNMPCTFIGLCGVSASTWRRPANDLKCVLQMWATGWQQTDSVERWQDGAPLGWLSTVQLCLVAVDRHYGSEMRLWRPVIMYAYLVSPSRRISALWST